MTGPIRIRTVVYMDDDSELEALVDNRDFVRWDEESKRQAWGDAGTAKFLFQTYCAWSALQRAQAVNGMGFDEFKRRAVGIAEVASTPVVPFVAEHGSD